MTVHLIKLCVGVETIRDLEGWIAKRMAQRKKAREHIHTTRMTPARREELLDGGSLYWVIRGQLSCRQRVLDLRGTTGADGIARCQIVLDPKVVPVMPRPCRAFQGWRYLRADEIPADLPKGARGTAELPEEMRRELRTLGLL
jgi:hypothetical protein